MQQYNRPLPHLQPASEKRIIRVPKTWRKTFSLIWHTFKTDKVIRRKYALYAAGITIVFWGTLIGFVGFLYFFGPGGGGTKWRQSLWDEIAGKQADADWEEARQQSLKGQGAPWLRNMFAAGITRMPTLESRAKALGEERYRTWQDVMSKGFPKTPEEYKMVSKMRPETLDEYQLMADLKKEQKEADVIAKTAD